MKICPTCNKRFEDEDIVFCPADGRLLAEDETTMVPTGEESPTGAGSEEDENVGENDPTRVSPPEFSEGTPVVEFGELMRNNPSLAEPLHSAPATEYEPDVPTVDISGATLVERTAEIEARIAEAGKQERQEGEAPASLNERPTKPDLPPVKNALSSEDARSPEGPDQPPPEEAPTPVTAIPNLTAQLRERLAALSKREEGEEAKQVDLPPVSPPAGESTPSEEPGGEELSAAARAEALAGSAGPRRTLWGVGAPPSRILPTATDDAAKDASGPIRLRKQTPLPKDPAKPNPEPVEVKPAAKTLPFDVTPAKGKPRPPTRDRLSTQRPDRMELPGSRPAGIASSAKPPTLPKVPPLTSGPAKAEAQPGPAGSEKPASPPPTPPAVPASVAPAAPTPPLPSTGERVQLPLTTLGKSGPSPFDVGPEESSQELVEAVASSLSVAPPEPAPSSEAPTAEEIPQVPTYEVPTKPGLALGDLGAEPPASEGIIALTTGDVEIATAAVSSVPVYEEHEAPGDLLLQGPFQRALFWFKDRLPFWFKDRLPFWFKDRLPSWVKGQIPWVRGHLAWVIGGGVGLVTILVVVILLAVGGENPDAETSRPSVTPKKRVEQAAVKKRAQTAAKPKPSAKEAPAGKHGAAAATKADPAAAAKPGGAKPAKPTAAKPAKPAAKPTAAKPAKPAAKPTAAKPAKPKRAAKPSRAVKPRRARFTTKRRRPRAKRGKKRGFDLEGTVDPF